MLVSYRAIVLSLGLALSVSLFAQQGLKISANFQSHVQEQQSGDLFKFKANVDRVIVDVVVNDAKGKAVRGLNKRDFFIYEDEKSQDVLSFDVHNLDSDLGYFTKLPPMPANTFVNIATERERGPLYVLLLDLVNTEIEDQMFARQQLLKFVDGKPQGTRFAVFVVSDGLYLVQGFSADRAQLHATLDPGHSIPHVPRVFLLGANYGGGSLTSASVFNAIALFLTGLPGRKNIIWVSGKFPLDLFPHNDDQPDTRERTRETLDALSRTEAAIYTVDVTGVLGSPPGMLTGSTPGGASSVTGPPGTPVLADSHTLGSESKLAGSVGDSIYANQAVAGTVAELTGGRAFYSRNDLKNMLEAATEAGSDYYTLSYSPSNKNFDGKLRNIRLELAEKGYHLEYRRAYLATGPQSSVLPSIYKPHKGEETVNLRPIGDSLAAYMQHGAPTARDVYFQAHVRTLDPPHIATAEQMASLVDQPTYFHLRQKKHPNKPLKPIMLQSYMIEYQIIARIPNLEVAAGVYDDDGSLLNGDVEEASSANPKAPEPQVKYSYFRVQQKIDVPEKAVSLRLGVRDLSTDRMGTMEILLPLAPEPGQTSVSDSKITMPPATKQ